MNTGDISWVFLSSVLVFLMTIPGLALFYAGMVNKKNVLATMMQSFAITALVTVLWAVAGYSLAFTNGSPLLGDLSRVMLGSIGFNEAFTLGEGLSNSVALTIPESMFMLFQLSFAIITPALIVGAFADRIKFSALLAFSGLWSLFVYAPIAHWTWHPAGFLFADGVLDFAGGTVVHVNAGIAGLVAALVIGKRQDHATAEYPAHNLVYSLIGAGLLWVGWLGFNGGSALAANGTGALAVVNTMLAGSMAAISWMAAEWILTGKPTVSGKIMGAVAGLVVITPASGFVSIQSSLIIGLIAGAACYSFVSLARSRKWYDDSLDCFNIHGFGGVLGSILVGVFATKAVNAGSGVVDGNWHQLWVQLEAIAIVAAYCAVATFAILKVVQATLGLRVSGDVEENGLDNALHGEVVN